MTSHGSESVPSLEALLESERHRRIVAEAKVRLLEERQRDVAVYLAGLTDTPLKLNVINLLSGQPAVWTSPRTAASREA
jgi:hypothetical protein